MKINFNVTGAERKSLVGTISTALNEPTKYLGVPTFAYQIGDCHIDKNGVLETEGSVADENNIALLTALENAGFNGTVEDVGESKATEQPKKRGGIMDILVETLNENGVECERMNNAPTIIDNSGREHNLNGTFAPKTVYGEISDTLTIELPWKSCGDLTNAKTILQDLIASKSTLIKAALGTAGTGNLPIEFTAEDTVKFEWLKLPPQHTVGTYSSNYNGMSISYGTIGDADSVLNAWSEFLCAAVKFSKTAKRITAKDSGVLGDNPKFEFRCMLVKLGLKGAEYRCARKTLLMNLAGDAAFATPESKAKWQAKHQKGGADGE